jgi:cytoskeletal protein CcmA (bactofilin family)
MWLAQGIRFGPVRGRIEWCQRGESNPHDPKGRQILSLLRLPVPPLWLVCSADRDPIHQAVSDHLLWRTSVYCCRPRPFPEELMTTTIGASLKIQGEISSDEDLVIEGRVGGQILMKNAGLTIGKQARVEADVRGARVQVLGAIEGNIAATDRIELAPSADVRGDLTANRIVLVDGATFNGRIDMDQRTIARKVAEAKTAQTA